MQELDDEALVRAHLAHPDGPAGALLIERWQDRAYQWAFRVVRDRESALDIAQDALVRMYQALPNYQPCGKFGAWVFAIVHNRAKSALRPRSLVRDPDVDLDSLASSHDGPEDQYVMAESEQRVLDAMNQQLDPDERLALWLRAYEGMGMDDLTELLGIRTASGARGLLQTARRKLRRALGEE
jgi:RNA polymerase sigma-70 factor (ECF subfamily)